VSKRLLKTGFRKNSEKMALSFRKGLGLNLFDPLPARELARHLKIEILTPKDITGLTQSEKKILLNKGAKEWSAVTVLIDNNYIIIHNDSHLPERQESNLMHEIAHILCDHKVSSLDRVDGLLFRKYNPEQEAEASFMGACLQLPRLALKWALSRGMQIEQTAIHFNASIEMVRFRTNITYVKKNINR
jgi:Zn-dependent peptidase ImmA (M78 family)